MVRHDGTERSVVFSERFACPVCGLSLPELEPRQFSFNSPFGACPDCHGVGTRREVNAELILGDPSISILEGVILPWGEPSGYLRKVVLPTLAKAFKFDLKAPWAGTRSRPGRRCSTARPAGSSSRRTARGAGASTRASGRASSRTWSAATANPPATRCALALEEFMVEQPCQTCGGKRLKPESLAVLVDGQSIGDVVDLPVERALEFFEGVPLRSNGRPGLDPEIAGPILKEVSDRLRFLRDVGLDYLTLGRAATSLSGGETQRIRLATQIGSRLVGVLYILDEPSIGLHQRDNERLLGTLRGLRDLGNTVIVVEHDDDTIVAADHVIDLGPRAGRFGGEVVAEGPVETIREHPTSLTGRYLRSRAAGAGAIGATRVGARPSAPRGGRARQQPAEPHRRHPARPLRRGHRRVRLGKSTLVTDILYQALGPPLLPRQGDPRRAQPDRGARPDRQGHRHRPEPDRPDAAVEPGHVHRAVHARSASCSPSSPTPSCGATARAASPST